MEFGQFVLCCFVFRTWQANLKTYVMMQRAKILQDIIK